MIEPDPDWRRWVKREVRSEHGDVLVKAGVRMSWDAVSELQEACRLLIEQAIRMVDQAEKRGEAFTYEDLRRRRNARRRRLAERLRQHRVHRDQVREAAEKLLRGAGIVVAPKEGGR